MLIPRQLTLSGRVLREKLEALMPRWVLFLRGYGTEGSQGLIIDVVFG